MAALLPVGVVLVSELVVDAATAVLGIVAVVPEIREVVVVFAPEPVEEVEVDEPEVMLNSLD